MLKNVEWTKGANPLGRVDGVAFVEIIYIINQTKWRSFKFDEKQVSKISNVIE